MSVSPANALVDTQHSRAALLRPIDMHQVQLTEGFWCSVIQRNAISSVPTVYRQCLQTGALANFQWAAGSPGGFAGRYYSDSDVYKWVEAASWSIIHHPEPTTIKRLEEVVESIIAAQQPDGYINTYFSRDQTALRWTDLANRHELYCIGHLTQAAIAHYRATGQDRLLDTARRACALVDAKFGPHGSPGVCGHPNLEMALVELFRATGETRWLELAESQLNARGHGLLGGREYLLDHLPVREQHVPTGHAVRALYLYAGMTDVTLETGDKTLQDASKSLWHNLMSTRIGVTGGVGSRWDGESIGEAYELPDRPYHESCAGVALVMWAWRMLLLTGQSHYRDVVEWAMYNAVLPAVSADGTTFFYQNVLADSGRMRRSSWFDCACCPPNVARLLAGLPGMLATTTNHGVQIQLPVSAHIDIGLPSGRRGGLAMVSRMPAKGRLQLRWTLNAPESMTLAIPAPAWSTTLRAKINGQELTEEPAAEGYITLDRRWFDGDVVEVSWEPQIRLLQPHPYVTSSAERVALARGPIVYCVEQVDHEVPVSALRLTGNEEWRTESESTTCLSNLTTAGLCLDDEDTTLFRVRKPGFTPRHLPVQVTAIPYFAWANRTPGPMRVMLPLVQCVRPSTS